MANLEQLRREMFARSFSPTQWWERDDDRPAPVEEPSMWVYREIGPREFAVGFYTPTKEWVEDLRLTSREAAADRVHYLNGGGHSQETETARAARRGYESSTAGGK